MTFKGDWQAIANLLLTLEFHQVIRVIRVNSRISVALLEFKGKEDFCQFLEIKQ